MKGGKARGWRHSPCGYPDPIRAHAVLGTDREKPVFRTCFSRAAHVQAPGSSIMDGRTVRPDGASSLSLVSLFHFLSSSSSLLLHRCLGGGTRNNPCGRRGNSISRLVESIVSMTHPSSSVTELVTQITDTRKFYRCRIIPVLKLRKQGILQVLQTALIKKYVVQWWRLLREFNDRVISVTLAQNF